MVISRFTRAALSRGIAVAAIAIATVACLTDPPVRAAEVKAIAKIKVTVSEQKVGSEVYTVGSAVFPVERAQVWAILIDYKNASRTFANLAKSEVIERKDNSIKLHQIVKPGYFPFTFDYVVDLTETPMTLIEWHRLSGSFATYNGSWALEDVPAKGGEGTTALPAGTRVTYRVFLDANKFIPQWLMRRSLRGYLPEVFDSLRKELNRQNQ